MGAKLQAILDGKERSQGWLARKMGRKRSTVCGWCKTGKQIPTKHLVKVAEILEVQVPELIG